MSCEKHDCKKSCHSHLTAIINNKKSLAMLRKLTTKRAGFTLVEIMIVVAIIALLAAIAVPGFLRARKRSQASRIINDLRLIDSAVDQYAIENNKSSGFLVPITEWTKYLKAGTNLYVTGLDILGEHLRGCFRGYPSSRSGGVEKRAVRCGR